MKGPILILFVVSNVILAYYDANRIKQDSRIYHGLNGLVYIGLLTLAYLLTVDWGLIAGLTLLRIPVFNTALNYFRGKELTYISKHTTSIVDQLTNRIPEKVGYWTYHTVLLLVSLILIML
jgi:uncharacterized membrane protein